MKINLSLNLYIYIIILENIKTLLIYKRKPLILTAHLYLNNFSKHK